MLALRSPPRASSRAYRRYGLSANRVGAYLATLPAMAKKYPQKKAGDERFVSKVLSRELGL